jgi:hypothetical protein
VVEIEHNSEDEVLAVARAYCTVKLDGHDCPDPTNYPTWVKAVRAIIAAVDALEAFRRRRS